MKKFISLLVVTLTSFTVYSQNNDPYAAFGHKNNVVYESAMKELLYIKNKDSCSNIKAIAIDAEERRVFLLGAEDSVLKCLPLKTNIPLTWLSVDPKADKYPGLSPYNFCNNNPILFVDPDGRSANPVYDFDGNLMGTDEKGLQGRALFMSKDNFSQGMNHDAALANDKGVMSLRGTEAINKFSGSFNSLPSRPDYDGKLTLNEANNWYRNGNGKPLYVDLSQIDLGTINAEDFSGVGSYDCFNLYTKGSNSNDFSVYGSITLKLYPNSVARAYSDNYDFEMHQPTWSPLNWARNIETYVGGKVAGPGTPYGININGAKWIRPTSMIVK